MTDVSINKDFRWNKSGYLELMKSDGVRADLARRADAVARAAEGMTSGTTRTRPEFSAEVKVRKTKAVGVVSTKNYEAMRMQARHDTLVTALGQAGGK